MKIIGAYCLSATWLSLIASVVRAEPLDGAASDALRIGGGGMVEAALFYLVAAVTAGSALGVCATRNIVRMAVWLFVALGAVAMLYLLLAAPFLAAIQLVVYAGGTLILLIFGVMLTSKSPWVRFDCPKLELVAATGVCVLLLVCLVIVLTSSTFAAGPQAATTGATVADLGRRLMTTYLVPFEVGGVLLMIVMVGAAHLARQER